VEPRHEAEVRVVREEDAQPLVLVGYHIPSRRNPHWFTYELLGDIAGSGRSSRLYQRLVKEDQVAAQAGAGAGFLGNKYPALLIVQALVNKGSTPDQVEAAAYEELDRLAKDGPTAEELEKVKTMNRASFVRGLRSNMGLAGKLAEAQGKLGDWHRLFQTLDQIDAVTAEDIQKAAAETFRPGNRVVGVIRKPQS
jgi:predicted Zn-dependent peptidase